MNPWLTKEAGVGLGLEIRDQLIRDWYLHQPCAHPSLPSNPTEHPAYIAEFLSAWLIIFGLDFPAFI